MVRQAERAIDHPLAVTAELDDEAEHMISLAVGALGGGFASGAILFTRLTSPPSGVAPSIGAGALLNLVALVAYIRGYVGFARHADLPTSPHPG